MSVERDMLITKAEIRRRQDWAAEERLARQARREAQERQEEQAEEPAPRRGSFGWLRRLAGAR
jgi:hypothetical protein